MRTPFGLRSRRGGGAILLMVLVVVAIIAVLYFARTGGSKKSYVKTVRDSRDYAEAVVSKVDLVSIYKSMQVYAAENDGKYPPTPEELGRAAALPENYLFYPTQPFEPHLYIYLPGQDQSMPKSNVLIYEATLRPDGKCLVLRLGGQVELLLYAAVQDAIAQTQDHLK